jgi:nitrite reductase/ring-hydroxylating ferredoxin subunit
MKIYHQVKVVSALIGGVRWKLPVYDNLHSDKSTGQEHKHYHVDTRYIRDGMLEKIPIRIFENQITSSKLLFKRMRREVELYPTRIIKISNILQPSLMNGHCPHKGYDLSCITPVNGVITCPLHNLKFDSLTGKLITS